MNIKLFLCLAFKALTVENKSHRGLLTLEEVLKQSQQVKIFICDLYPKQVENHEKLENNKNSA